MGAEKAASLCQRILSHEDFTGASFADPAPRADRVLQGWRLGTTPLLRSRNIWYATRADNPPFIMNKNPRNKIFRLNTIVDHRIIAGSVSFAPAPLPGVLTELARFEAERLLVRLVREEIAAGRL
jgi:hypothetical protein